ncbi:MAG: PhoH family protein [Lachnospiraceae bacterium]|jgi:phosphate starvation-inducible PhoH-like protein
MNLTEAEMMIPVDQQQNIFGQMDQYLRKIEKSLGVTVVSRDGSVRIIGSAENVAQARSVLDTLAELARRGNEITEQNVDYTLASIVTEKESGQSILEIDKDIICRTVTGKPVKPKTAGQKHYVDQIRSKMITFGIGPAGTGKTYLAMAMAISAFKAGEVSRIILTRPAIEAGEKLGFLPGDLQSKIDPYLRPLYDALYQIMGAESYLHNSEKGLIEVAPLAYMRGRTLDNAYIILDEAQNTTPAQMKMFLTRIGFGSKVVVTGDMTQKDLPEGEVSGLDMAIRVLEDVKEIGFCWLDSHDVVRHPLVQKIVEAYEKYEKAHGGGNSDSLRRASERRRYENGDYDRTDYRHKKDNDNHNRK